MLVPHWGTCGPGHQGERQRRSPGPGPGRAALSPGAGVLTATRSGDRAGWSRGPVPPFAVADGDGAVVAIQVFDPQAHAFHQPQIRAIQRSGHQLVRTRHLSEESLHLVVGQDGGQASGFLGAQGVNRSQVLVERLAGEKEEGGTSLILGRGSDPLVACQGGEERFDVGDAHVPGVAFVVEQDEAFDPVDVGLFSADGGVFEAQRIPDLVQQFPGFWFHFL